MSGCQVHFISCISHLFPSCTVPLQVASLKWMKSYPPVKKANGPLLVFLHTWKQTSWTSPRTHIHHTDNSLNIHVCNSTVPLNFLFQLLSTHCKYVLIQYFYSWPINSVPTVVPVGGTESQWLRAEALSGVRWLGFKTQYHLASFCSRRWT